MIDAMKRLCVRFAIKRFVLSGITLNALYEVVTLGSALKED
ncbi:hypothetical protein L911_1226 [Vibrio fluvialis I21563]|nr:hypothetical protein L911_1226 [Vibrio fluvialis I21563]